MKRRTKLTAVNQGERLSLHPYPFNNACTQGICEPWLGYLEVVALSSDLERLLDAALSEGRAWLLEPEAKQACRLMNIATARFKVAHSLDEALTAAEEIGYPVVLKVVSPDILHKSDVGGVVLDVKGPEALKASYNALLSRVKEAKPEAKIVGVLVEEMLRPSLEVAFGLVRDPQFGPAVMFGLGGIYVELYRDVTFRIAPISVEEAQEMIREVKVYRLLTGYRGMPKLDIEALVDIALKLSKLGVEHSKVRQVDLNPVMVYEKGAIVADARMQVG